MKPDKKMLILMTCLMAGCQSTPQKVVSVSTPTTLLNARKAFASGELYAAKRQTELFLKDNPSSVEGQKLMGQILDEELTQHKDAFKKEAEEEFSQDRKKAEIKTLLERSRSLLEMGEYDAAAEAAESVFGYEAQNTEASRLLDQIKQRAWVSGKREIQDGQEIVKAEVDDRAVSYRRQAQGYAEDGQWGAAQMSIQKLLLLYPEDKEGLKLLEQIKNKQRQSAVSTAQS